jgi:membrane associated rhomboid family serine protease
LLKLWNKFRIFSPNLLDPSVAYCLAVQQWRIHDTVIWRNIRIALVAVAILWGVYFANLLLPIDLNIYGLRPRTSGGLWGIAIAPFLHGGIDHLTANSGALFVLLVVSLSYSRRLTLTAIFIITLLGGAGVWLLGGSNTVHIGASGIIFGLIGFLMFAGIFRRDWKSLVISLVVFFFYGGALLSLLIYLPGVSWTGHLCGFLSGVLAASWTKSAKSVGSSPDIS